MGSWFSSPARAGRLTVPGDLIAEVVQIKALMRAVHELECATSASDDDYHIRDLAYKSLAHYNSNHPDAKFRFPAQPTAKYISLSYPPTEDMKCACVGFRKDLWYHLNFSACPRTGGDTDERTFFAELRYDNSSLHGLVVETCTILEKQPFGSSSSRCALCPDDSNILHPDDAEFVCGKEGHEREFFRERRAPDGTKAIFTRREMLMLPFLLGSKEPRYRLP